MYLQMKDIWDISKYTLSQSGQVIVMQLPSEQNINITFL